MKRDRVILRAQFNPPTSLIRTIPPSGAAADHDVLKLFRGCQSTLARTEYVYSDPWHRLSADLTGWNYRILRLDGTHDVRHVIPSFAVVRLYPQPHGILAGAKHRNTADAGTRDSDRKG